MRFGFLSGIESRDRARLDCAFAEAGHGEMSCEPLTLAHKAAQLAAGLMDQPTRPCTR